MEDDAPEGLHPMTSFDPSKPPVLHDVLTDKIITWDWERAGEFLARAETDAEGHVTFDDWVFDGWGNVLGG